MNDSHGDTWQGGLPPASNESLDGFRRTGNVKDSFAVIGLRNHGLDFMADMVEVILEKLFGDEYRDAIEQRDARNHRSGRS